MNSPAFGLRVAGTVFGIVSLAQLLRLLLQLDVVVGQAHVPLAASGIAAVFTGVLCVWLWRLSGRATA
jgi:hypothetical protein